MAMSGQCQMPQITPISNMALRPPSGINLGSRSPQPNSSPNVARNQDRHDERLQQAGWQRTARAIEQTRRGQPRFACAQATGLHRSIAGKARKTRLPRTGSVLPAGTSGQPVRPTFLEVRAQAHLLPTFACNQPGQDVPQGRRPHISTMTEHRTSPVRFVGCWPIRQSGK